MDGLPGLDHTAEEDGCADVGTRELGVDVKVSISMKRIIKWKSQDRGSHCTERRIEIPCRQWHPLSQSL